MAVVINPICEELAVQRMHPPQHIYAIDFSGAQDAGKKNTCIKKHSCSNCMVGSLNKCNLGGRVENISD